MTVFLHTGTLVLLLLILAVSISAALFSYFENEKRASLILSSLVAFIAGLFFVAFFAAFPAGLFIGAALLAAFTIMLFLSFLFKKKNYRYYAPRGKIDERKTMFSRAELKPDTQNYTAYYNAYPEDLPKDTAWRKNPGLAAENSKYFEPFSFAASEASFYTVEQFKKSVYFSGSADKKNVDNQQISLFLKQWALNLGAHNAGITPLKNYHLYNLRGREDNYGKPVRNAHTFALAFTVEMDKSHIDAAPKGPTLAESAKQYLNAGNIALQLAAFINTFGYSARAHIDGNYEVVCPLVARDAGLGEIGRMGLLMTPKLGPRVRIAVVTTDMPLPPDKTHFSQDIIDFCTQCKKCADVCPSNAISFTDRQEIQGVVRWQINQEACFNYWTIIGTDCARCVSVCPYSHKNNLMHNLVRLGLKKSAAFRKAALKADDLLYGRKPKPKKPPALYPKINCT